MSIQDFKRLQQPDRVVQELQQNTEAWTAQFKRSLVSGNYVIVTFPVTANTDLLVTHNLGWAVGVQWLEGSRNQGGFVYLSPNNATNTNLATQIILRASVPSLQIGLWFFNTGSLEVAPISINSPTGVLGVTGGIGPTPGPPGPPGPIATGVSNYFFTPALTYGGS